MSNSSSDSLAGTWAPSFFASLVCAPTRVDGDTRGRGTPSGRVRPDVSPSQGRTTSARLIDDIPVPELVSRVRAGDRDALAILYLGLFDELWHIALLQTRSPETASEIVQDVFLRLWSRHTLLPVDANEVYLAVAVRNQARNVRRHARVVDAVIDASESVQASGVGIPPAMGQRVASADAQLEDQEFREAYHEAIRALSDQERLAVFLRWEEEWGFEEIGQVLSMSKVGARKVVLRAQKKVQTLLAKYRG